MPNIQNLEYKKYTLVKIAAVPFPQNFISDALRRDIAPEEVPSDFLDGLQVVLSELVRDSARGEKIIRLRYEEGLSLAAVAKEIGVHQERIRSILNHVRTQLFYHYRTFLCEGFAAWQAEIDAANMPLTSPEQVDIDYLWRAGVSIKETRQMQERGIQTLRDLQNTSDAELLQLKMVGPYHLERIREQQRKLEKQLAEGTLLPV